MYLFYSYREWFRQSCLNLKEAVLPTTADETLLTLLNKSGSIRAIASR